MQNGVQSKACENCHKRKGGGSYDHGLKPLTNKPNRSVVICTLAPFHAVIVVH